MTRLAKLAAPLLGVLVAAGCTSSSPRHEDWVTRRPFMVRVEHAGVPVEGAHVYLSPDWFVGCCNYGSGPPLHDYPSVMTDAAGRLRVTLAAPHAHAHVEKEGFASRRLLIPAGDTVIPLEREALLHGRVTNDLGQPVSGATVTAQEAR